MSLVFNPQLLQAQFSSSLKLVAFVGFLATATLFIGFNHKVFEVVFGEKSKTYWWLFALFVIVPFLLVIYIFSFLFGGKVPVPTS
jgi:hypothetical protein